MPVSRQTPSRFGPSHCGQSSARSVVDRVRVRIVATIVPFRMSAASFDRVIRAEVTISEATEDVKRAGSVSDGVARGPSVAYAFGSLFDRVTDSVARAVPAGD